MRASRVFAGVIGLAALIAGAMPASAQLTVFTDRTLFEQGRTLETWNLDGVTMPTNFGSNPSGTNPLVEMTGGAAIGTVDITGINPDIMAPYIVGSPNILLTFQGNLGQNAIGFDYAITGSYRARFGGSPLDGILGGTGFFGVIANGGFNQVELASLMDGSTIAIDNLSFGLVDPITDIEPPIDAVPEPGTWIMMIVGFGLVGMSLRKRQQRSSVA